MYGWFISQKLPLDDFSWFEETSLFNKYFIKSYNEDSDTVYFLEADVQYSKYLHNLHNDLSFLLERMKIKKIEKLVTNLHKKKRIWYTQKKLKTSTTSGISIEKGA